MTNRSRPSVTGQALPLHASGTRAYAVAALTYDWQQRGPHPQGRFFYERERVEVMAAVEGGRCRRGSSAHATIRPVRVFDKRE
jgi:hypothetical protein